MRTWLIILVPAVCGFACAAAADTITVSGTITQSTADGTGPAVNNASLNAISDGDTYAISLDFAGSITAPGTYDLTGGSLTFGDPTASASETAFAFISLTISPSGSSDELSLLGCLSTGSGCALGNQLDLNFAIPSGGLNALTAPASAISGLSPPLDLLEDDGSTDIQGSIATYSYSPPIASAPEPGSLPVLFFGFAAVGVHRIWRRRKFTS